MNYRVGGGYIVLPASNWECVVCSRQFWKKEEAEACEKAHENCGGYVE